MASLTEVVEKALAGSGVEVEKVTQVKAGSRVIVRIVVDGDGQSGTGLNLDEVARASAAVSARLDDTNVMGDKPYVLEVGTPGVERPLTKPAHWRRNIARLVRIARPDQPPLTGRIIAADEQAVQLEGGVTIRFDDVKSAQIQVEMRHDEENQE
ncbi:MAG: ribosome maturation factor RimP [Propionibacteriaceae bacterium]|jgi:ribosome maturation factor RimP|nr:ribosome maturation factor RimP [Propionibacteriaceae bacterium]